jgi:hypothetical protein
MTNPNNDPVKIGRLAMREEGDNWNAYFAKPDHMAGTIYLGSIRMAFIINNPARKEQFVALMRDVVGDMMQGALGVRPSRWDQQPAPEHERTRKA